VLRSFQSKYFRGSAFRYFRGARLCAGVRTAASPSRLPQVFFVRTEFDLPMSVGAIAMSLSTLIVAANAQLLRRPSCTAKPLKADSGIHRQRRDHRPPLDPRAGILR